MDINVFIFTSDYSPLAWSLRKCGLFRRKAILFFFDEAVESRSGIATQKVQDQGVANPEEIERTQSTLNSGGMQRNADIGLFCEAITY
jgi:hypothetical protein